MITRRRCSRFASAKVRLFRKLAKGWERFFKKNAKKRGRKEDKWREEGGYTLYIIYREEDTPRPVRASQWGLLPSKDTKVYSILSLRDLFALGGREREEGETENGTDAGSESRSEIYFDYAEQQGGKDREAGLKRKRKTNRPPPSLRSSSPEFSGTKKTGNGKRGEFL